VSSALLGDLPDGWTHGLVLGASGAGKSTLLGALCSASEPCAWDAAKPVAAYFGADAGAAPLALRAGGLGDVRAWVKPYPALSAGQRAGANLARKLTARGTGAHVVAIDDYANTPNREAACAMAAAAHRFVREHCLSRVVFATYDGDISPYLQPSWVLVLRVGGGAELVLSPHSDDAVPPPPMVVATRVDDRYYKLERAATAGLTKQRTWEALLAKSTKTGKKVKLSKKDAATLKAAPAPLRCAAVLDGAAKAAVRTVTRTLSGRSCFHPPLPLARKSVTAATALAALAKSSFTIGLLCGASSGSGKSTLLTRFGAGGGTSWPPAAQWSATATVASHFGAAAGAAAALDAVALPPACHARAFAALSSGEQYRANLALALHGVDAATLTVVDDFGAHLDCDAAAALARSVAAYMRAPERARSAKLVVAACGGESLAPCFVPEWSFNTRSLSFVKADKRVRGEWEVELTNAYAPSTVTLRGRAWPALLFATPTLHVELVGAAGEKVWPFFARNHWDHDATACAFKFKRKQRGASAGGKDASSRGSSDDVVLPTLVALWNGRPVGLISKNTFPGKKRANTFRIHRLCVLPEYEGVEIEATIAERLAADHLKVGKRVLANTQRVALGAARDASSKWRAGPSSTAPAAYAHEYVGDAAERAAFAAAVRSSNDAATKVAFDLRFASRAVTRAGAEPLSSDEGEDASAEEDADATVSDDGGGAAATGAMKAKAKAKARASKKRGVKHMSEVFTDSDDGGEVVSVRKRPRRGRKKKAVSYVEPGTDEEFYEKPARSTKRSTKKRSTKRKRVAKRAASDEDAEGDDEAYVDSDAGAGLKVSASEDDGGDDGAALLRRQLKAKAKKSRPKKKGKGISKRILSDRQLNDTTKAKIKEEKARLKRIAALKAAGGDKLSAYHEEVVTLNGARDVTGDDCVEVSFLLFTVTFHANHAHNLTRSP
jgi:hypothetical protein